MPPDAAIPPTLRRRPWTDAQRLGITTTGRSLLVSAAAGSGKTAMLAARCAYLVCDAPQPCDVDELLVVTFTEAAAGEMKGRIHQDLRARIEAEPSDRLQHQLALVDQAQVSTLHAFCAKVLRQHFHAVELDPSFTVLDGDEAALLRREVARTLFDERYESDASGDFHRFVDAYGEGDDGRLMRRVIDAHEMLQSLAEPEEWLRRARQRIEQGAALPLDDSQVGRELVALLDRGINSMRGQCRRSRELIRQLGGFDGYSKLLAEWTKVIEHFDQTLHEFGIDALREVMIPDEELRLPPVKSTVPNKDLAKEAIESVRDALKEGPWREVLRFTAAEWREGLATIRPHAEVFLGLVYEFGQRYAAQKAAVRSVDFADLERLTLRVLRDEHGRPTRAARTYHRRFKHVLVDEYQDINEVQDAILALLSQECLSGQRGAAGNLFCVGDVKQSIYRFRLAEAHRFLERQKLFRDNPSRGQVIDLQHNFRSRGTLLHAINGVFERLMTADAADIDYDLTHRLHAGLKYPPPNGSSGFAGAPIELHLLPKEPATPTSDAGDDAPASDDEWDRTEREAVLVARRIRQMMGLDGGAPMQVAERDAAGNWSSRPLRFSDIVVLLRAMRYKAEQFSQILARHGIPVYSQSSTGYFESMEIRDVLAVLSLLDNQRQDLPLAAVIRSPISGIAEPENCLARIRLAYPQTNGQAIAFHEAVIHYAKEKDDELAARLRDFLADLNRWRDLSRLRPLAELIWTIYHESGYLAFCAGLHGGEQRVANLMDLHRRAGQFGSFHRQGLSRFLQFLQSLRDEADLGQPAVSSEADDVARVMSIHRSKGLEFPVVFVPDLGKGINLQDCAGSILFDRTAGLGLSVVDEERLVRYPSLASTLVKERLKQQALAEELRVLYVAMTRAKEHLILVGTCDASRPEKWKSGWSDHQGPLPADDVLGAKCMLDWIGPVAAAASGTGESIIEMTSHSDDEVAAWEAQASARVTLSPKQQALAALRPLKEPPPTDAAQPVIDRLAFRYRFAPYTRLQASDSVTRRGKQSLAATAAKPADPLARPRFLAGATVDPTEIGTATHLVLQHLDFAGPCDAGGLGRQIDRMVERRLLLPAQAALLDRPAILWLLETDIGKTLRQHADRLLREVSIYFAEPEDGIMPATTDPLDRIMIRGRLDLFLALESGSILIDYKTDQVHDPATIQGRADSYAGQMRQYRDAVQDLTGIPVATTALVFLTPRVIQKIADDPSGPLSPRERVRVA